MAPPLKTREGAYGRNWQRGEGCLRGHGSYELIKWGECCPLLNVFRTCTAWAGIALLVLSPLSAAGLSPCDCPHDKVDVLTLRAAHCCQSVAQHRCCHTVHNKAAHKAEPMVATAGPPRLPQPCFAERLSPLPPVVTTAIKPIYAARAERPPGWLCLEPSLYQSWLI